MDGFTGNGVQLDSALLTSSGSGGSSGGVQSTVQLAVGPNGDSRRSWRLQVSPLINDKNALFIQYQDKNGSWQTGQVVLARS